MRHHHRPQPSSLSVRESSGVLLRLASNEDAAGLCAGVDYTHPDLMDQVDHSQSASCVGGVLNTSQAAYMDTFGHGTCVLCLAPPAALSIPRRQLL